MWRASQCRSGHTNPSPRSPVDSCTCSRSICPTPVPPTTASPARIPHPGRSTCNSRSGSTSSLFVALVTKRRAGAVAVDAQASLLTMCRRLCHHHGGIVALVMMALLPSPVHRHLAVVELALTPSSLIIELVTLLSMRRSLFHHCNCNCCPHHDGVVTIVDAQASLLLLSWCHCPHNSGFIALDLDPQWHCSRPRAGVV